MFVLFAVLNLLFSIRGFAQQEKSRSHDVDSLLLYETESGEDSLVYGQPVSGKVYDSSGEVQQGFYSYVPDGMF